MLLLKKHLTVGCIVFLFSTMLPALEKSNIPSLQSDDVIRIPLKGFYDMNKNDFCSYLLKQKVFINSIGTSLLSKILNDFKADRIDFFNLFIESKNNPKPLDNKNRNLISLYQLLGIYQNKGENKRINIYNYIKTLPNAERKNQILFISLTFSGKVFDDKIYPFVEQWVKECFDDKSLKESPQMLSMIFGISSKVFDTQRNELLADIAVRQNIHMMNKRTVYNNNFYILANHAGKISQPYFDLYFENEFSAFNLIAVGKYYKRNFDEATYKSIMQRKILLLKDSVKQLEQELMK